MLTTQNTQLNSIFERLIKDVNGNLIRVRFTVVEINGKFQGKIISAEPLKQAGGVTLCLPILSKEVISNQLFVQRYHSKIVPYTLLDFFMSQPTRAPAI